jgi:radical SAM superfamily enzyme YgiQ (UPF0313 family)
MKNIVIISFNLIREGENEIPLSIASILANLKQNVSNQQDLQVLHFPVNLNNFKHHHEALIFEDYLNIKEIEKVDFIGISCFIWNQFLINPIMEYIKNTGFKGKFILGGSQITYAEKETLKLEYPNADIFISGNAESSIVSAITDANPVQFYNCQVDFEKLSSPYLTNEIRLNNNEKMIRWETKRGCPFACSFCAHRNLENGRVNHLSLEKAIKELYLFKEKNVKRINVLDPIFNFGKNYMEVMKAIKNLSFSDSTFTFQSKIELLNKQDGKEFLSLIGETNSHLEFGLQTVIPEEFNVINRKNDIKIVKDQLKILKEMDVSYEVSLIYGLPNQTLDSFKKSIDFVVSNGCTKITAWPLMLLKGTNLFTERAKWKLEEEIIGEFDIPVVTSSSSFNRQEWESMDKLAKDLMKKERY